MCMDAFVHACESMMCIEYVLRFFNKYYTAFIYSIVILNESREGSRVLEGLHNLNRKASYTDLPNNWSTYIIACKLCYKLTKGA